MTRKFVYKNIIFIYNIAGRRNVAVGRNGVPVHAPDKFEESITAPFTRLYSGSALVGVLVEVLL